MKKNNVLAIACALLLGGSSASLCAQESGDWSMTVGADAVSSYLWRGFCSAGPSIQPSASFDYEKDDWAVSFGYWATTTLSGEPYNEHDFFVEASWKNLTLSLTDYGYDQYFGPWKKCHDLDFGLSYTLSEDIPVTFSWYSIINKYEDGFMHGSDKFAWGRAFPSYFEVAYDFSLSVVDFSLSAGVLPFASGYYDNDTFGVCNLNLSAGHEFELSNGTTFPVSGQVMYNPMDKGCFWGVSVGYYFSVDL